MQKSFSVVPIGFVRKKRSSIWIEIDEAYQDGMLGLDGFSHIYVLYWFHRNDTPQNRKILRVRPRGDQKNPLTGVFGTHSPVRPNLIALTRCKITALKDNRIQIEDIDALDGSPVVDIKCYIPDDPDNPAYRVPEWV